MQRRSVLQIVVLQPHSREAAEILAGQTATAPDAGRAWKTGYRPRPPPALPEQLPDRLTFAEPDGAPGRGQLFVIGVDAQRRQ